MLFVDVLICVPLPGEERMFITDNFTVKESDHLWIFVREVLYLEVTTQVGILLIHMLKIVILEIVCFVNKSNKDCVPGLDRSSQSHLEHHLHIVLVSFGLLVPREPGAVVEETATDTRLEISRRSTLSIPA